MKKIFRNCSLMTLAITSLFSAGYANDSQQITQALQAIQAKGKKSAIYAQVSNVSTSHTVAPNAHVPFDTLKALKGISYHKSKGEFTVHEGGLYMVSYFVVSAPVVIPTSPAIQQFGVQVNGKTRRSTTIGYSPEVALGSLQEFKRRSFIRMATGLTGGTLLTLTPTIIYLKKNQRVRLVNTSTFTVNIGLPTVTPSGIASAAFFLQKM